jgi:hypothetical protein
LRVVITFARLLIYLTERKTFGIPPMLCRYGLPDKASDEKCLQKVSTLYHVL